MVDPSKEPKSKELKEEKKINSNYIFAYQYEPISIGPKKAFWGRGYSSFKSFCGNVTLEQLVNRNKKLSKTPATVHDTGIL